MALIVKLVMKFTSDHVVAFTYMRLQPGSIDDGDVAPVIINHAAAMQITGSFGDTFTTYPEHAGDQLLRHIQIIGGEPITARQQQATKPLLDRVMPIAARALGYL